ncbi:N-methyl-L-tryptophan oxidase [Oceanobacillus luteolus]|uniref:N-methyl-L-tryptophan oxidase n=1 Tax=Oceanobacillus luteolus TaxID=1274358 RepID=A0ABW4HSE9_9BACI
MDFDVVIVGAGTAGMAAGYFLSKRGKRVALIDAYDPPHTEGSNHGETRIIRHAYGEGSHYVSMALRASELWGELEQEVDRKIFYNTGVLNIGTKDSAFLKNVITTADTFNLPVEVLSAEEVNNRWPGFKLEKNLVGCFEKTSGVLLSEEAIRAYRELSLKYGAILLSNAKIEKMIVNDSKVEVRLDGKKINGNQLLITAGKGTNHVLSLLGLELPLTPLRKTFSWFQTNEEIYNAAVFPAWTFDDGNQTYYGFPSIEKSGFKIGRHDGGMPVDPLKSLDKFGQHPADQSDVTDFAEKHFSSLGPHNIGKVCTYNMTPDGDFIIDRLPNYSNIFVASGFSGHGFKFGSVIGEILSQMMIDKDTDLDITPFALSRFV